MGAPQVQALAEGWGTYVTPQSTAPYTFGTEMGQAVGKGAATGSAGMEGLGTQFSGLGIGTGAGKSIS